MFSELFIETLGSSCTRPVKKNKVIEEVLYRHVQPPNIKKMQPKSETKWLSEIELASKL